MKPPSSFAAPLSVLPARALVLLGICPVGGNAERAKVFMAVLFVMLKRREARLGVPDIGEPLGI